MQRLFRLEGLCDFNILLNLWCKEMRAIDVVQFELVNNRGDGS